MSGTNKGFDPRQALSPQSNWRLIDVLHEEEWWSMAIGRWRDDDVWRPVLAQRWNGGPGEKGNPVSHGYPTWFVLPAPTYKLYINSEFVPESKRVFVRDLLEVA